ncbi:flavodoxin [Limosilactobacillus viscerum]|uniref:flavodoxin n=1 Tax=Limosilactobacillus viscerum TaxID=2993450 RepID=UPI0024BB785B|nr:flavodoxin [Limosilactobacillus viscerum]
MKKVSRKWIALIAVVVLAIVGGVIINNHRQVSAANSKGKRTLIVYFSRTQGIYGRNLRIGNTKRIADDIQKKTGGTEFEIRPQKDYPSDYDQTARLADQERREGARPAIKGPMPDVSKYDTIFIGSPVWYNTYPMVVRTFMDRVNLNSSSKTVIPFTTNEGSGLGETPDVLKSQYPNAKTRQGFTVRGTQAAHARNQVNRWLDRLGY